MSRAKAEMTKYVGPFRADDETRKVLEKLKENNIGISKVVRNLLIENCESIIEKELKIQKEVEAELASQPPKVPGKRGRPRKEVSEKKVSKKETKKKGFTPPSKPAEPKKVKMGKKKAKKAPVKKAGNSLFDILSS